jgi:YidC/Oxa1 family membrane protein insertase
MDKKSLIGIVVIGVIFGSFMIYNNYKNKDEVEAAIADGSLKAAQDSIKEITASTIKEEPLKVETPVSTIPANLVLRKDSLGSIVKDELNRPIYADTVTGRDTVLLAAPTDAASVNNAKLKERFGALAPFAISGDSTDKKLTYLENDKIKVTLSNYGGNVVGASLLGYKSYDDFASSEFSQATATDEVELFNEKGTKNGLSFQYNGRNVSTTDMKFKLVEESSTKLVYRLEPSTGSYLDFIYKLEAGKNHVDFSIAFQGMSTAIPAESVMLQSETNLLRTERLMKEQRRIATFFYKGKDDKYDYLSESSSDDENEFDTDLEWVSFKQSYFSTFWIPETPFKKAKSNLEVYVYDEEVASDAYGNENYIKKFKADLNLGVTSTENSTSNITWFFGPNDYDLLSSYDNDAEDVINLGWGLFRWVNIYAIQPLFNWLSGTGMAVGLAIFLLTLIVKLALSPVNFKMYTSSAKMKILKPEMEAITAKYPDKADAMKKQQETMALQKESGASPLAGCVPMLIQMPILFAVFRFFPSTFELRQKSFLWAEDLSSFDSIASWTTEIPLLSSFYGNHVSLFTLLMAITTLFYTHLNSGQMQQPQQEGMPNMKVIMYFFPIMMIFFFNSYSSGLSYYYFISTLMSIGIMYGIKAWFVDEKKIRAKMDAKKELAAAGGGKKKSGFADRLEKMQQAQQDKLKNQKKK